MPHYVDIICIISAAGKRILKIKNVGFVHLTTSVMHISDLLKPPVVDKIPKLIRGNKHCIKGRGHRQIRGKHILRTIATSKYCSYLNEHLTYMHILKLIYHLYLSELLFFTFSCQLILLLYYVVVCSLPGLTGQDYSLSFIIH